MLFAGLWDTATSVIDSAQKKNRLVPITILSHRYSGKFDEVSTFTIITVPVSKQLSFVSAAPNDHVLV